MFKINGKGEWKKAKIILFNNKIKILNKYTQECFKIIKLSNIKKINNCLNSSKFF